ncbi:MAG TPA: flagellar export chaperone FliS [Candidatus Hydrogenedentes bacterium]|nr:flagellar export chaperone FliS [Candidatus Hydrogenedentota bacterium]HPG66059.1 flagellar export chaperone FliS [Candidatus Hydrogenedentota bacterium]
MAPSDPSYGAYRRVEVETASQGKLVVMLFNGAIQRAEEAKRQMAKHDLVAVHNNLVRAQEIVAEIRSALNMEAGPVAHNLNRIYEYFQHLLIQANIHKDPSPIDECVGLMTSMRDTWEEAFLKLAQEGDGRPPAQLSRPNCALIDVQG